MDCPCVLSSNSGGGGGGRGGGLRELMDQTDADTRSGRLCFKVKRLRGVGGGSMGGAGARHRCV